MAGGGRHLGFRGQQVLALVNATIEPGSLPLSYAMIADRLGMSSVADVCNVVRRLEKRGLLRRCDTGTRHRQGWHQPVIVAEKINLNIAR